MPKQTALLQFSEVVTDDPKKLTKTWACFGVTGPFLGTVKWWAHWRRYCFFPEDGMLFDANCLREIAEFLVQQTTLQKDDAKTRKEQERIKALKATPVSDPEKFQRCEFCGVEIPKEMRSGICDDCVPF